MVGEEELKAEGELMGQVIVGEEGGEKEGEGMESVEEPKGEGEGFFPKKSGE